MKLIKEGIFDRKDKNIKKYGKAINTDNMKKYINDYLSNIEYINITTPIIVYEIDNRKGNLITNIRYDDEGILFETNSDEDYVLISTDFTNAYYDQHHDNTNITFTDKNNKNIVQLIMKNLLKPQDK